jgi:hypothetical protein
MTKHGILDKGVNRLGDHFPEFHILSLILNLQYFFIAVCYYKGTEKAVTLWYSCLIVDICLEEHAD